MLIIKPYRSKCLYVNQNGVRYTYDDNDNLTGVVPLYSADAVSTAFNDNNTVSSENSETSGDWTYTYDEEISTLVDYIVQEDLDIKIDYVYNDFGQLLSTTLSRYDATSTEQTSPVITSSTEYTDDFRHVDFTTSETGLVTTYTYDSKDRVGSVSAGTAQTNYTYQNGTDRLLSTTARVDDTTNASVSYAYDAYGQLTGITRNGMTYTFGYDTFGNRTTVTAGGQLLSSKFYEPNNGMLKYSYDAAGNQTAYTYDEQDRLVSQMYTWNTGFNSMQQFAIEYTGSGNLNRFIDKMSGRTWQYHYDLSGRLHRLTNNKGFGIRYTYDDYDRVIGQRFRFGTSYSTNDYYDISYTYGDLSIPMSVSFGGTTKTRTLDTLGRTGSETLTTTGGANWVTNYGYLSPGSGKTSTVVNSVSMPSLGETYQYIYDENGNINQILRWGSSNPVTPLSTNTYLYDDIGQLTFENGVSYTYDTAGNILSKRYNDGTVIPYTYRTSGWTDQLISYNGQSITYDSNGNALTWQDGLSFTWSNSKQLATVSKNGTSVASYTYDAFGTRATKVVNGVTTTFYYVDDVLYMQDDGTNRIWYYYDATGTRIAMECNGIMSYYIYNLQGDVIGLYDSTGQVVARYTYDSWGKPLTITAANGGDVSSMPMHLANMNPFRYRGYYYDVETGLYYLNSRYYDSEVGRFIMADELISTGCGVLGYNMYAYCNNNPVVFSDNSGLRPIASVSVSTETSVERSFSCAHMKGLDTTDPVVVASILQPKTASSECVQFIANYEGGFHAKPYDDGYGNQTIGYGHLIRKNEFFTEITKDEALQLLSKDLSRAEKMVSTYATSLGIVLSQNQYDAFVSLAYNSGGYFRGVMDKIISGENPHTAFSTIIYAGGKKSLGLYRRRMDEADIYTEGTYTRTYRGW